MKRVLLIALFLSLGLSAPAGGWGGEPPAVVLTDTQARYPLSPNLSILQDRTTWLTIDQVSAPECEGWVAHGREAVPNLGYTGSAYWVRFRLRNETSHTNEWWLELGFANMQHASLYLPLAGPATPAVDGVTARRFQVHNSGTLLPLASRDLAYHKPVFKIPLSSGEEQTIYLRFQNGAAMTLPLTLWSPEGFAAHSRGEMLFTGLAFGACLIMLGIVSCLLLALTASAAWRGGYQASRYYLLAWTVYLIAVIVAGLVRAGVLPSTTLTEYGYHAGFVLQALLMSLVLSDQVNRAKQERIAAQTDAVAALRAKEQLIHEQNARLEAQVAERTAALRESEARFRTVVESSVEGILVQSDTQPLFVNQAYVRLLGYSSAADLLAADSVVSWIAPYDRERLLGYYAARVNGEPAPAEYEYDAVRRDGSTITLHQMVTTISWAGQPAVLSAMIDVTGRKRAEEQLRRQTAELARSNEDLEHFAYVVSHDLQEPLRTVIGYLDLLAQCYPEQLAGEPARFVATAAASAQHMADMIAALLDLSRVGTRAQPLEVVDCEVLLARVLDVLQVTIANSGAAVTHDRLPALPADEAQLAQVLQNLIANAVKFRRAGVPPRVHVGAERRGDEWCFAVRDNGIGLDPQQADRLFQIFARLHTREPYPGLGLGLALCRRIVERHGGQIWVESEPGQGATFYFTLPA